MNIQFHIDLLLKSKYNLNYVKSFRILQYPKLIRIIKQSDFDG